MQIRDATEADLPGILEIYNDAVRNTAAIWNETPVDLENRRAWWRDRLERGYPVLVACEETRVLAYASFGDWRAWEGYRHTVEHSIYVRADMRGRGIATRLLPELIGRASGIGKHMMVAGIESGNAASIRLHARHGFEVTGEMREVGAKFGRWLDLTFMQRLLDARPAPEARR